MTNFTVLSQLFLRLISTPPPLCIFCCSIPQCVAGKVESRSVKLFMRFKWNDHEGKKSNVCYGEKEKKMKKKKLEMKQQVWNN